MVILQKSILDITSISYFFLRSRSYSLRHYNYQVKALGQSFSKATDTAAELLEIL
jgi:hypothetical protein